MNQTVCIELVFSRHAVQRMFERGITTSDVRSVISNGASIAEYPEDKPFPARLILGFVQDQPIHVVVAFDESNNWCNVVTVYRPDPMVWSDDFTTRRA